MLTEMMRSPVLVVPALAQAPPSLLATVYVFKNRDLTAAFDRAAA